jgi:predicted nucleic acid-binding protein
MPKEVPVFFLDANIIMYALGGPHLYREPCRKTLAAVEADAIDEVTSVEVLQGILHRYRTLGNPDRAEQVFQQARTLCEVVLPVPLRDMDLAVTLLR